MNIFHYQKNAKTDNFNIKKAIKKPTDKHLSVLGLVRILRKIRKHNELKQAICRIQTEKCDTLPSLKSALDDGGNCQNTHYDKHERNIEDEGCVHTHKGCACGYVEGSDGDSCARNENKVEDVCADDVTERECAVTLHKRGNCGYKLGKAGAESYDGKRDNGLGNVEDMSDLGCVGYKEICAYRNDK